MVVDTKDIFILDCNVTLVHITHIFEFDRLLALDSLVVDYSGQQQHEELYNHRRKKLYRWDLA